MGLCVFKSTLKFMHPLILLNQIVDTAIWLKMDSILYSNSHLLLEVRFKNYTVKKVIEKY